MKPKLILPLVITALYMQPGYARPVFPSVIGNNMVLQQRTRVPLWGKSKPGAKVYVMTGWNRRQYITKAAADSTWKIQVETPEAGGPFDIRFNDGDTITLRNILIGEVWLCAGQSNMECR